jgi:SAM-dependent methyltransferase
MQLPYENESFDVVIDIECIYANSLKDSTIIMQEINRVLKVGGSFFSITFMTGTYGDGNGIQLEGEPNTYLEIHEGALKKGYGIIRFTSEEDIYNVYNVFQIDCINYIIRSEKNRSYEVREWVISCRKKANIKAEAENGN